MNSRAVTLPPTPTPEAKLSVAHFHSVFFFFILSVFGWVGGIQRKQKKWRVQRIFQIYEVWTLLEFQHEKEREREILIWK